MKKILLSSALILIASLAFAGVYQDTGTLYAGAATNKATDSYAVVNIAEIDFVNPLTSVGITGTVTLIHAGITQTVAIVTGATAAASANYQWMAPASTTNIATWSDPAWTFTNASSAAAITVATGNVIRTVSLINMVGTATTGIVSIAQVGVTNLFPFSLLNTAGQVATTVPAVNTATITVAGIGTNVCTAAAALSAFGPTVTQTTTTYGGPKWNRGPGDSLIFSGFGTNAAGSYIVKGFISP